MRPKIHIEELRHYFSKHADIICELADLYRSEENVGEPGVGTLTQWMDDQITRALWGDEDENVMPIPLERFNYMSGRADNLPEDVRSARSDGRPTPVPKRFRSKNAEIRDYSTPLNVGRDYPEDPEHITLIEGRTAETVPDAERQELGEPDVTIVDEQEDD